ncbi:hypothetical protein KPH14_002845 [Odynerus spinipes]|uniref:Uncharacterized protein n=1 Tax=Odynerus spinipes TaxID=1348599 RepID=A0AAD9RGI8_9HYME|nr:hypothetical protein KPH14_002845 [Odynerus spinipes]
MVRTYTFGAILLLAASFCVGEETQKKLVFDLSELIDRANPLIKTAILDNKLDPMQLPNISRTIALSTVNITSGHLYGLSQIQRNKPAILTYEDKQFTFDTGLEIKNVTMDADYYLKRVWTQRYGKVSAHAWPLQIEVGLHLDLENFNFTLTRFNVNKIKHIKVKLTGNNNSDWIVNALTNVVTNVLNNYIRKTISSEVSTAIQDFLDKFVTRNPDYMLLI